MKKDSTLGTILVAVVLCLVCSIIVSVAAVKLKPLQQANKDLDRKYNILASANMLPEQKSDVVDVFTKQVETKVVDLRTGQYSKGVDAKTYDQRAAAKDPDMNIALTRQQDIAGIKATAKYATVYLSKDENQNVKNIILPVHGYGLWSTLYGFLALEGDANTVVGLSFFSHAETPGLGGEVDNPNWKAHWPGKKVLGTDGSVALSVVKNASGDHQIDALAGATLTSNGVHNLVQFWLGENGFGPYLQKIRAGQ